MKRCSVVWRWKAGLRDAPSSTHAVSQFKFSKPTNGKYTNNRDSHWLQLRPGSRELAAALKHGRKQKNSSLYFPLSVIRWNNHVWYHDGLVVVVGGRLFSAESSLQHNSTAIRLRGWARGEVRCVCGGGRGSCYFEMKLILKLNIWIKELYKCLSFDKKQRKALCSLQEIWILFPLLPPPLFFLYLNAKSITWSTPYDGHLPIETGCSLFNWVYLLFLNNKKKHPKIYGFLFWHQEPFSV